MKTDKKDNLIEDIKDGMLIIKYGNTDTSTDGEKANDYIIENSWIKTRQDRMDLLYILLNELTNDKLVEAFKDCYFQNFSIPEVDNLLDNDVTLGEKNSIRSAIFCGMLGQQFLAEKVEMKTHMGMYYNNYTYSTYNYILINKVFHLLEKKHKLYKYSNTFIDIYELKNAGRLMLGFKGSFEKASYQIIDFENYSDEIPESWFENDWLSFKKRNMF